LPYTFFRSLRNEPDPATGLAEAPCRRTWSPGRTGRHHRHDGQPKPVPCHTCHLRVEAQMGQRPRLEFRGTIPAAARTRQSRRQLRCTAAAPEGHRLAACTSGGACSVMAVAWATTSCCPGGARCRGGVSPSRALAWNRRTCRLDSGGRVVWAMALRAHWPTLTRLAPASWHDRARMPRPAGQRTPGLRSAARRREPDVSPGGTGDEHDRGDARPGQAHPRIDRGVSGLAGLEVAGADVDDGGWPTAGPPRRRSSRSPGRPPRRNRQGRRPPHPSSCFTSLPRWMPACHCGTCRRPPRTPTRARQCAMTGPGPPSTGTPPTSSPPTSPQPPGSWHRHSLAPAWHATAAWRAGQLDAAADEAAAFSRDSGGL